MTKVTVKELVESGVHFGHQASRWNPKMKPYIYGKKNLIHVIDLRETMRGLIQAKHFLGRLTAMGAQILFVGTKRQIKDIVASESERANMPVVIERWIGGTLTNYHTIKGRLERLEELERLEADGTLDRHSKKLQSRLRREMRKINRNLGGIRNLNGLPGALVVIDPKREDIAVKEAAKMNVPIVAILDTDCDPDLIDIPIPGNDDALRSVQLLLGSLVESVIEGVENQDREAMQFKSEIPELKGRDEPERGRGRRSGGPGGGRQGVRIAGGRFADRHAGGKAAAVSFGRASAEELAAQKAEAEKAKPEASGSADAPAPDAPAAPAAEAPAAAAPVTPAPEAPAPEAPAPAAPAPEAPAAEESAPEKKAPEGGENS